ncbi:ABC-three component system protein [Bacillus mycoides]|uniref:ABC-three component system protein n=1 Tax=Bacillus mycoides TaxID=1405 RepID=UPI00273BF02F|nr:ABC-three component system protein [Bacillus mycoides]
MFSRIMQIIAGKGNKSAGRDINETNHIYNYNPHPIRFFENDLKDIICVFSDEVNVISNIIENTTDFKRPNIEKKNELNDLSESYFEHIKRDNLAYFDKISLFLKDPRNKNFLERYLSTTNEINRKIVCNRNEFKYFEVIFDAIYNYVVERADNDLPFDKDLIWVFLHFMYYNCDIGEKYDKTS